MADQTGGAGPPPDIPGGVGPHETRELELMLAGHKPAAMFSDALVARRIIPETAFEPHVLAGRIIKRVVYAPDRSGLEAVYVYYALPGEAWRIAALEAINHAIRSGQRPATTADDIETGRLLGYSEAEIAAFMAWTEGKRTGNTEAATIK